MIGMDVLLLLSGGIGGFCLYDIAGAGAEAGGYLERASLSGHELLDHGYNAGSGGVV